MGIKFILHVVSECKLQYLPSYLKFLVYRANKPPLGQLIRSFIVTPPPPVYIKLNPRVRPGPHPTPVFMPLLGEEGVTLSASSMWVLRYPYPLSFIKKYCDIQTSKLTIVNFLKVVDPICRTSQNYTRMENILWWWCIWNLIVVGCKMFK